MQLKTSIRSALGITAVAAVIAAIVGYILQPSKVYTDIQVDVVSEGLYEKFVELRYRLPAESEFYSPGANYEKTKGDIRITVTRIPIKKADFKVDLLSEIDSDGIHTIKIPYDRLKDFPLFFSINGVRSNSTWNLPK